MTVVCPRILSVTSASPLAGIRTVTKRADNTWWWGLQPNKLSFLDCVLPGLCARTLRVIAVWEQTSDHILFFWGHLLEADVKNSLMVIPPEKWFCKIMWGILINWKNQVNENLRKSIIHQHLYWPNHEYSILPTRKLVAFLSPSSPAKK